MKRELAAFVRKLISDQPVTEKEVILAHTLRVKLLDEPLHRDAKELLVRSIETLLAHEQENVSMLMIREIARCCEEWPDEASIENYWLLMKLAGTEQGPFPSAHAPRVETSL